MKSPTYNSGLPLSGNTMETCADCTNLKTFECGWCPTLGRCSSGTDRKRDEWLLKGCDKAQAVSEDECASVEVPVRKTKQSAATVPLQPSSRNSERTDEDSDEDVEGGGVGTVMGVLIPFGLVFLAVGWLMYAYRNPHTKSGQLLIQVGRSCKSSSKWTLLTPLSKLIANRMQMNGVKQVSVVVVGRADLPLIPRLVIHRLFFFFSAVPS